MCREDWSCTCRRHICRDKADYNRYGTHTAWSTPSLRIPMTYYSSSCQHSIFHATLSYSLFSLASSLQVYMDIKIANYTEESTGTNKGALPASLPVPTGSLLPPCFLGHFFAPISLDTSFSNAFHCTLLYYRRHWFWSDHNRSIRESRPRKCKTILIRSRWR